MLVSIVTINYKNREGLLQTLDSVKQQTFTNFEHILIDGGSTDGSAEVIKAYAGPSGKWLSEKDMGVYDAQNKGIRMAIGTYLLFLNSGDYFYDSSSLDKLTRFGNAYDIVYGDIVYKKGEQLNPFRFPDELDMRFMFEKGLPHQATLIKRKLFDTIGLYNIDLRIVADWEFFLLALFRQRASYVHVPSLITVFDCTGMSSAEKNIDLTIGEQQQVLSRHFPSERRLFEQVSYYIQKKKRLRSRRNPFNRIWNSITRLLG
jgi:glycosyltransferase involved in cell wall biosynthesis